MRLEKPCHKRRHMFQCFENEPGRKRKAVSEVAVFMRSSLSSLPPLISACMARMSFLKTCRSCFADLEGTSSGEEPSTAVALCGTKD